MAGQPGTTQQRRQTSWCTVHHSSCASSVALQRHLLRYDTGIESRDQLVHGGARGCAVEAFTLAKVIHRWQGSRARPSSASRPAGAQCITRPAHLASRCSSIYSGTARASRASISSCMVVHVDAQLKLSHLLRCSTDGRAAGHDPAATPYQLARSAAVVLVI